MIFRTEMRSQFRDELHTWVIDNKRIALKIFELMRSIECTPYEGIGKPEPLKHDFKGLWSRRIDKEHRLIYEIDEPNNLIIFIRCYGHYVP
jgi:toxin YoeB